MILLLVCLLFLLVSLGCFLDIFCTVLTLTVRGMYILPVSYMMNVMVSVFLRLHFLSFIVIVTLLQSLGYLVANESTERAFSFYQNFVVEEKAGWFAFLWFVACLL